MSKTKTNCKNRNNPSSKNFTEKSKNRGAQSRRPSHDMTNSDVTKDRVDDIISNDISWYDKAQPLYDLSTNIPFAKILGQKPILPSPDHGFAADAVPGIMTIEVVMGPGYASNSESPLNKVGVQMYDLIVSKTTGALQMQQMDPLIFLTSMDSICANIAYAKKVLGLAKVYVANNNYTPEAIIKACGFDKDEIVTNFQSYVFKLNDIIRQFNNMQVLNLIDVHTRHYALMKNVYLDEDNTFAQMYTFTPRGYYTYVESGMGDEDMPAYLHYNEWRAITNTEPFGKWLDIIQYQLSVWLNSSDLPIIKGNLMRAYPDSAFLKLDPFGIDEFTVPVLDRNIAWQVNNLMTHEVAADTLDIVQDPAANVLLWTPGPKQRHQSGLPSIEQNIKARTLNSYDANITKEFAMEATRLIGAVHPAVDQVPNGTDFNEVFAYVDCSTELVTEFFIYQYSWDSDGVRTLKRTPYSSYRIEIFNEGNVYDDFRRLIPLSKFRNHPQYHIAFVDSDTDSVLSHDPGYCGDQYIYTTIDQEQLRQLNYAALLSMYRI